ncbi:MAG: acetolactate synthase small subunit [Candidatus Omnitrophica bacterium]|nr:acetolactate synthase small subunit [Candidatus Omnitrophota bacterium]
MIGRHTVGVLVANRFGVLARVSGLFSARGFNIASLAVGETEDPSVSRMTIVVEADGPTLEQVKKQLNRLIDVIKVQELTSDGMVDRELIMIKVSISPETRTEILQIAEIFRAKVVDINQKSFIIEATGDENKIVALVELLRPFGIKEVVRTGRIAVSRGPKTIA